MNNKEILKNAVEKINREIGCYSKLMDKVCKKDIEIIISNLSLGTQDLKVKISGKSYVIEIVDMFESDINEIDFVVLSESEYKSRYGEEIYN